MSNKIELSIFFFFIGNRTKKKKLAMIVYWDYKAKQQVKLFSFVIEDFGEFHVHTFWGNPA